MNNFHQNYRKWKIEIYHIYCTLILNHDLKKKNIFSAERISLYYKLSTDS